MKLTRTQLRRLVEDATTDELKAQNDKTQNVSKEQSQKYKPDQIWLLTRNIAGPFNQHHAWVHIKTRSGKEYNLSGKSGVVFAFSKLAKRMALGRDTDSDEDFDKYKEMAKLGGQDIDSEATRKALDKTSWGKLQAKSEWDADKWGTEDKKFLIAPRSGDTPQQVRDLVRGLIKSFMAYERSVGHPYDPLPHKTLKQDDRNSNSFAYSLLKNASLGTDLAARVPQEFNDILPGWGIDIGVMDVNEAKILRMLGDNMKLTKEDVQTIMEELLRTEEPSSEMSEFSSSSPGKKVMKEGRKIMSAGKAINELAYHQTGAMRRGLGRVSEFVYKLGEALSSLDELEENESMSSRLPTVNELRQLHKEIKRLEKL